MRFTVLLLILSASLAIARLSENDRRDEYYRRNYTWPTTYIPNTEGWKKLMDRRFAQVTQIPDSGARYEGYLQTMTAAITAPNFTESGWGLTRAPQDLVDDLREAIREGLPNAPEENKINVIEGQTPLFIHRSDLTKRVLKELLPMHEKWAGVELMPSNAYGFRVYRDGSRLNMHVDKPQTHVISSILHIDHSEDSEPWPLVIEDFQGNTNEVVLESGDMLFYESSKCFHGRPRTFKGSWYTSVFTHYRPADIDWKNSDRTLESHYAIPPQWSKKPLQTTWQVKRFVDKYGFEIESDLEMVGTSIKEPHCPDGWCALSNSVHYSGPATFDEVLSTGQKTSLNMHDEL